MVNKALGSSLCKYCKNHVYGSTTVPIRATSSSVFYVTKTLYSCAKNIYSGKERIPDKYECAAYDAVK